MYILEQFTSIKLNLPVLYSKMWKIKRVSIGLHCAIRTSTSEARLKTEDSTYSRLWTSDGGTHLFPWLWQRIYTFETEGYAIQNAKERIFTNCDFRSTSFFPISVKRKVVKNSQWANKLTVPKGMRVRALFSQQVLHTRLLNVFLLFDVESQ